MKKEFEELLWEIEEKIKDDRIDLQEKIRALELAIIYNCGE